MTVARFIADQRTMFRVPHAACCRLLGVSESWFYKWSARDVDGTLTVSEQRRRGLDEAVAVAFTAARGKHGSPRLLADLRDAGWTVSQKAVAASMRAKAWSRGGSGAGATPPGRTRPASRSLISSDVISPPVARTSGGSGT